MALNATPLHGKYARVRRSGTNIGFGTDWSLSAKREAAKSHSQGDDWESNPVGFGSWSGSMTFHYVPGDANQEALINDLLNGTIEASTDFLVDQTNVQNQYQGSFVVTDVGIKTTLSAITSMTISFVGTGALAQSTSGT